MTPEDEEFEALEKRLQAKKPVEAEKKKPYGYLKLSNGKFYVEVVGVPDLDCNPDYLPLYTHPQPKREPLTDEQILLLLSRIDECAVRLPRGLREFARAIEAAHGIKD